MLLKLISFLTFISAFAHATPDRIGNGGGVWVCEDPAHTIYDIMFMDVFEARREYQLTLPETNGTALDLVAEKKSWIESNLKAGHTINKHVDYVEKNITWIDDVINQIPDAANKISPHPSTCKQGDWVAVQLVNFTDDFRVLVRRELFNSNLMTNMERAAVYLHEGIYSYMRDEYKDTTSVRARAIVGYILSDESDSDKVAHIEKILGQQGPEPVDPDPVNSWICGIKPERDSALYIAEDTDKARATTAVVQACKNGENKIPGIPGYPGDGGIPGVPNIPGMPNFGPPNHCLENKVLCESVTSSARTKSCTLKARMGNGKSYVGTGRVELEAQKEAINKCLASEGEEFSCYYPDSMDCK